MKPQHAVLLLAAIAANASATVTFERRWQWFRESVGRSVDVTGDGGYLVSGGLWIEGSRYGIVVLRTDSLGDTTWVRHILDTDPGGGYSCRLEDGGLAVLGTVSSRYIFVQKQGPGGDSVWRHVSGTRGLVSAVIPTADSGCLAVGRLPDTIADFGAVKLGPDGSQQWARYYEEPRVNESWARDATRTRDGGYILCGDCTDYVYSYVRMVRTDSTGAAVWDRLYSGPVGPELRAVCLTDDNGFLAAGDEFDTLEFREKLYIMRTDSAGEVVWTRSFAPAGTSTLARAMTRTRDGGAVVAGEIRWHDSTRVWIVRLDESGDTLWTCVLGGPEDETAYDIEQTRDLGYIITGESDANGGSLLLIKTDSLGQMLTGVGEGEPLPARKPGFVVAPNPAGAGRAEVRYSLPKAGPVAVRVFDVAGRAVCDTRASGHSNSGSLSLDLSKVSAGIHVVRLDADGYGSTQKLVVQR